MITFKKLWLGHPINESVQLPCIAPRELRNLEGKIIKPGFPLYANQCAIRTGVALKRAGVAPSVLRGLTTCGGHNPDDMHYIRATELAVALSKVRIEGMGPRQIIKGSDVRAYYPQLFGRTGIIYIQDYWRRSIDPPNAHPTGDHIDVWNGYRSSAKWLMEWFSWVGYYSNYAEAREIWFWEVK
jgi:hypothetical protein